MSLILSHLRRLEGLRGASCLSLGLNLLPDPVVERRLTRVQDLDVVVVFHLGVGILRGNPPDAAVILFRQRGRLPEENVRFFGSNYLFGIRSRRVLREGKPMKSILV